METATVETSAPSQSIGNVSQSEQAFLDSNRTPAPKQEPAQPTDQVVTPGETPEQLPEGQPNELPPTVEYKIKDIHGNEKAVSPEWMAKYFQAVGQESLIPLINDEKNAPLLLHIAERTLKLNNAYQEASRIRPEYENYKSNVETYLQNIRQDPGKGFEQMMADMGISEADQEAIIEKMALGLIEKREMSPEQRAAQAAVRAQQEAQQQAEEYRRQVEEYQIKMDTLERQPLYQTGMASALAAAGIEINDSTWAAMIQGCKDRYGSQKEPITQAQFNAEAQRIAQLALSFKKANTATAQPATPTRTVSKGFQGKAPAQPVNKGEMTEDEWLASKGMKKY